MRLQDFPISKTAFYGAAVAALSGLGLGALLQVPAPKVFTPGPQPVAAGPPQAVADAATLAAVDTPPAEPVRTTAASYTPDDASPAPSKADNADQDADREAPVLTDANWNAPEAAPPSPPARLPPIRIRRGPPLDPYLLRPARRLAQAEESNRPRMIYRMEGDRDWPPPAYRDPGPPPGLDDPYAPPPDEGWDPG